MGKKKNKNKVSGAVKTAAKTDKKIASKLKKELANLGEEDIAKVVAEIEREEAKRLQASEKALPGPPSPRAYATLTPHPTNNELILFGGEYHNGQKTEVYSDLLFFNPANNTWRRVKAPGGPPPRSAHQAVATPANKGELWIFGGEYTSPSETQFHHYRDLWCFSLTEKKWEKVIVPNGPSPRSGHRMALMNRQLFVFGGYHDDGRDCRYFDDLHCFCLDQRLWTRVEAAGRGPCARSAAILLASADSLIVYGGFSRVKEGRTERTQTHTDMFRLVNKNGAWTWRALGAGGPLAPPARAGQAAAVNLPAGRGYVFGGVLDVEETEEELRGEMSDSLLLLDLEAAKWHSVTLRAAPAQARPGGGAADVEAEDKSEEVTVVTDEVFTMTLGPAPAPAGDVTAAPPAPPAPPAAAPRGPCARMSAMLAVQRSVLYVYGGVLEKDEKQFYLSDLHCLDLHKLSGWRTLVSQPRLPDWLGSDSETESGNEGDSGSASGSDSDSEDE